MDRPPRQIVAGIVGWHENYKVFCMGSTNSETHIWLSAEGDGVSNSMPAFTY
jgi:hypothetical protein